MDKKLKAYIQEAEKLAKNPSKDKREYHLTMLQHFQHERQIHLYVTLAFAFYMILFFFAFLPLLFTRERLPKTRGNLEKILPNPRVVIA